MKMHIGIDYGSKLAGTTVLCYLKDQVLHCLSSQKKQDADKFISEHIVRLNPDEIFIDAPLSLPAAYSGKGENFHFRACDKLTGAMSPMFLGGLTARAMSLRSAFRQIPFYESYPSYLVKEVLKLKELYSKKYLEEIPGFMDKLHAHLPYEVTTMPTSWHEVDAILCWLSGHRFAENKALLLGDKVEGIIVV